MLCLKGSKIDYWIAKRSHYVSRDRHVAVNNTIKEDLQKVKIKDKVKMNWRKNEKHVGKRHSSSTLDVEYSNEGTLVRTTARFELEDANMSENLSKIKIAF